MRELHKAIAILLGCCLATSCIFAAAYLKHRAELTSADILRSTHDAVNEAIQAAIENGGLADSEAFVRQKIVEHLASTGFSQEDVRLIRRNDFNPLAVFYFEVVVRDISVIFRLEGLKDPLLTIRLGLDVVWREEPNHPYEAHGQGSVMSECLRNQYFHLADDGPDFFARLENKTENPYYFGVETFIVHEGRLAVDHLLLGGGVGMDEAHEKKYGLS